jgi:hypothetical protein
MLEGKRRRAGCVNRFCPVGFCSSEAQKLRARIMDKPDEGYVAWYT